MVERAQLVAERVRDAFVVECADLDDRCCEAAAMAALLLAKEGLQPICTAGGYDCGLGFGHEDAAQAMLFGLGRAYCVWHAYVIVEQTICDPTVGQFDKAAPLSCPADSFHGRRYAAHQRPLPVYLYPPQEFDCASASDWINRLYLPDNPYRLKLRVIARSLGLDEFAESINAPTG